MAGKQYQSGLASLFSTYARRSDLAPVVTCPNCGEEYTLGVNGTVEGCDGCTGARRAVNGFVIEDYSAKRCACINVIGDNPNCEIHGGG